MDKDRLIMARTLYGEARGEGRKGMEAVAAVIMNRVNSPVSWWGDDIQAVCLKPRQFSTWNKDDPNRAIIVTKYPGRGDALFDLAWDIAGEAMAGRLGDPTGGADHYFNPSMVLPKWAASMTKIGRIGAHDFYRA